MRGALAVLTLLAGCGRLGFDASGDAGAIDDDAGADAPDDAPLIAASVTQIDGFRIGTGSTRVVDLAAAAVPDGYAVAFITEPNSVMFGVHLDGNLAPNAAMPFQTSPVAGFTTPYNSVSLMWDGTNLVGSVAEPNGNMYMKTFPTDMTLFATASLRTGSIGEPSVGHAGTQAISLWFQNASLYYNRLQADGTPGASDLNVGVGSTIVASSAASGDRLVVVSQVQNGSCVVHAINSSGVSNASFGACVRPHVIGSGTSFNVAYEVPPSTFAVRPITTITGSPVINPVRLTGTGRSVRLFQAGGDVMVAYTDSTGLHIVRLADEAPIAISGLPPGEPDAIEVAGAYVFATYGATLYAVRPE